MSPSPVQRWHELLETQELSRLDDILADDVVFHSPVLHTPQKGKDTTTMYLTAAYHVLLGSGFTYVREVVDDSNGVFEFTAEIGGIHINGVDMIHWNTDGRIDDFKVMIRPLKAVNLLHGMMKEMIQQLAGS